MSQLDLHLPLALREPIEGIPFTAYLTIEAARLDGISDKAALAWLGIEESAFARAEERWAERLADALADDAAPPGQKRFDEVYEEMLCQALARWARPVPPLDRDVESWIFYQRHALDADDPETLARTLGLTLGDELRLGRFWRRRLAEPDVAARAQAAFQAALPPLPKLALSPIVFPPGMEPARQEPVRQQATSQERA